MFSGWPETASREHRNTHVGPTCVPATLASPDTGVGSSLQILALVALTALSPPCQVVALLSGLSPDRRTLVARASSSRKREGMHRRGVRIVGGLEWIVPMARGVSYQRMDCYSNPLRFVPTHARSRGLHQARTLVYKRLGLNRRLLCRSGSRRCRAQRAWDANERGGRRRRMHGTASAKSNMGVS